jgi:hypothetical protein
METPRRLAVVGALCLAGLASPARGQEELMGLLAPELGKLGLRSDYRLYVVPEQRVTGQPADLGMLQHDFTLSTPLWQDASDEWAASARVRSQQFDTTAVLPDTGEPFPDELWNIRLGATYRHRFDNGWIGGGHLTVSSPSDRPFHSLDELELDATALLSVPWRGRDAWLFFLNYSNTREFIPDIPVPGLGYVYRPSDRLTAVIATGFGSLEYRPTEKLTLMASYTAVRTVDARVMYELFRPVRIWANFDWTSERYFRVDRRDQDDLLFYHEKRVRLGATIGLARQLYVEVVVGYTFDRFYFEGEDYSDRHDNRVDVGDGPFASFRLGARF